MAKTTKFIGVRGLTGGFVMEILSKLAVLKKFTGGRVENFKGCESWAVLQRQCFAEVCKAIYLHRLHIKYLTESCEAQRFLRGPNGFGSGDVVLDLIVVGPDRKNSTSGA